LDGIGLRGWLVSSLAGNPGTGNPEGKRKANSLAVHGIIPKRLEILAQAWVDRRSSKQEPGMQQHYHNSQQPAPHVQLQQGRYFRCPLPQGWRVNETDRGVDLAAPDGLTLVSHAITRGPGQMTPDQMLRVVAGYAPQRGISNLRVTAARNVPVPTNGQATAYELAYEFRGAAVQAIGIYRCFNSLGDMTSMRRRFRDRRRLSSATCRR
jgi:hypothetical protein